MIDEKEPRPVEEILLHIMQVKGLEAIRERLKKLSRDHREAMDRVNLLSAEIGQALKDIAVAEKKIGDTNYYRLLGELHAAQGSRTCRVRCPKCGKIVGGMVKFCQTPVFATYHAQCPCGHYIADDEWAEVPYGAEAGGE